MRDLSNEFQRKIDKTREKINKTTELTQKLYELEIKKVDVSSSTTQLK